MMHYEELPIELIELNIEVTHHPILIRELMDIEEASGGTKEFALMLGGIAAYCEVILDGTYTDREIKEIATILTKKLQAKRNLIVLPETGNLDS